MVAIMGHRGPSCASVLSHPTPNSSHWLLSPQGSPGLGKMRGRVKAEEHVGSFWGAESLLKQVVVMVAHSSVLSVGMLYGV